MRLVILFVYFARVKFCPFSLAPGSGVDCDLCLWHSLDFSINILVCSFGLKKQNKMLDLVGEKSWAKTFENMPNFIPVSASHVTLK